MLKPFFSYYGGKWRAAPHYPKPKHSTIIEPFAGSAGYSVRYADRKVLLYDVDPVIVGVWDFLISSSIADVQNLPVSFDHIDDVHVSQEAKWLIGFWLNKGAASPCKTPSAWMRLGTHIASYWGEAIKQRIVSQQQAIRHWKIEQRSYDRIDYPAATWFIDPPYIGAGQHYRHSTVDFAHLGAWCRERFGQVIVCENEGAKWLPFQPFRSIKATPGKRRLTTSVEVIYEQDDNLPAWFR